MSLERNLEIHDYIHTLFAGEDESLKFARENSKKEGLKEIQVPAGVGKMLYLLAKLQNPKRVLEIGTLGGYSTLWLAKALAPGGTILTLENQEKNAKVALEHIRLAGYQDQIKIHLGDAAALLASLNEKFDLIFIDADKENYPLYLDYAMKLARPGTLILCDNLIPKRGPIGSPDRRDIEALAVYEFNRRMAGHPQLEATLFTTLVKDKLDALGVAIVR
ncbi:MAG TPA: O-methyltransferase [Rhabdochlamydiaceae bacterium]|nr:O-methyltransferase [Rhabdochlamydiaceae bacterium]